MGCNTGRMQRNACDVQVWAKCTAIVINEKDTGTVKGEQQQATYRLCR